MSLTERVDTFQRRHPVVGFPIGVIYKFGETRAFRADLAGVTVFPPVISPDVGGPPCCVRRQ